MPSKGLENKIHNTYETLIKKAGLSSKQLLYQHFDFHSECHVNSEPMMDLIEQRIFPEQIEHGGIFYETVRVVEEKFNNLVT
jgi:hypothetical protein